MTFSPIRSLDRRGPRAGEERIAVAKHHGGRVEAILVDETEIGEAARKFWAGGFNLPSVLSLQPIYRALEVAIDKSGIISRPESSLIHYVLARAGSQTQTYISSFSLR